MDSAPPAEECSVDAVDANGSQEHGGEESNTVHHLRQQLDHLAGNYDSATSKLEELTIHAEVLKKELDCAQQENKILRDRLQTAKQELEEERMGRETENTSNTGLIATLRQQVHDSRRAIMSLQEEAAQNNRRRQQAIESESSKRASIFGGSGIVGAAGQERKTSVASKRSSILGAVFQQSVNSSTPSPSLLEESTSPSLSATDDPTSSSFHRNRAHLALEGARNVSPLIGSRSPDQEVPPPSLFRRRTSTISQGVGLGLPSDMLPPPTTRQSSASSVLSASATSNPENRDASEKYQQLLAELQQLKDELSRTKTELREAHDAKEASDTCLQALREIISQGRLDGDASSLTQLSLPKLPTDTKFDDEAETAKPQASQDTTTASKPTSQGRWSIWGKKKSTSPTEANVPVNSSKPNVSAPLNEHAAEDSESSTPAAKSFGFSLSSFVPSMKNEDLSSSSSAKYELSHVPITEVDESVLQSKERAITPSLTDGASPPTSSVSSPKTCPADQRQSISVSETLSFESECGGDGSDGASSGDKTQSFDVHGITQEQI